MKTTDKPQQWALTFDGHGLNLADHPYKPRVATFTKDLNPENKQSLGALLESAPLMLEALEAFVEAYRHDYGNHNEVYTQAKTAIKQAKGEV